MKYLRTASATAIVALLVACGASPSTDDPDDGSVAADTTVDPDAPSSEGGSDAAPTDGGPCISDAQCAPLLTKSSPVPAGCAEAYCSKATGTCGLRPVDADGDGFRTAKCDVPGLAGFEKGNDCDDSDKSVSPGAWDGPKDDSSSKPDRCDAKDNDCNGKVDDGATAAGLKCSCKPSATRDCAETSTGVPITFPGGAPVGACKKGTQTCGADAQWGTCAGAVAPKARSCTEPSDLDCDGSPDNKVDAICTCTVGESKSGCYPFTSGTPGRGSCAAGTQKCIVLPAGGAVWDDCKGATGPTGAVDTCDRGNDANCNGIINEGCPCLNGDTGACGTVLGAKGSCAGGRTTCVSGHWGACSIAPGTDTCASGNDDSCNGAPNEGCRCINGTSQSCGVALGAKGSCAAGTTTCVAGGWSACSIPPSTDSCASGNDASCNGTPNEGCFCIDGVSAGCSRAYCTPGTSSMRCNNGKTGSYDACVGGSCPEFDLGESLDLSASNGHVEQTLGTCPSGTHVTSCERTYFNGVGWCDATQSGSECVLSTGAPWAQWSHCKGKTHCQAD